MSTNESPHDIVVISCEVKIESLAGETGEVSCLFLLSFDRICQKGVVKPLAKMLLVFSQVGSKVVMRDSGAFYS
jgi:hypothetical protein